MISKTWFSFAIALGLALGPASVPAGAQAPRKLRVAVLDFDYLNVRSETSAYFGSSIDVGRGMANLLTADLVRDGMFSVIGQEALSKAIADADFADFDRDDPASAVKLGKFLRADAVIMGTVTQFDTGKEKDDSAAASADPKTRIRIEARIINVDTGQTQCRAEGIGEASGAATVFLGGWEGWASGNVDFASTDFQQTVMGKAIKSAVDELSRNLILNASKSLRTAPKLEGVVAAVDGGQVVLNIGSGAGVMPGDLLEVFRLTNVIKDPSTGEIIRQLTSTVGVIKATDVDSKSSVCIVVSGFGFQEGDHVRAAP
jgi:curli biogenesis system outer membrane secretion channel CsgG